MTQSFDKWFLNQYKGLDDEKFDSCEDAWNAGRQSKQGEVDKLQAEINEYKEVAESMEDAYLREKAKVDCLQKRIDDALKAMDGESVNSWGLWKEKADMYEQGASNAYEKSYWILKGTTNEQ